MKLMYLRKSRSDDSSLTVEQVLEKHLSILQDYCMRTYGERLPEEFIYREVVSGETISDRPEMKKILKLVASGDVESVLVVEPQRLSRGDLLDCGTICRVFKYSNTKIETPNRTYNLSDEYDLRFFEMELKQGNEFLNYLLRILRRGRKQSAKSGQFIGATPPYGYDKVVIDKKKTLQPNADAEVVKLIYSLALEAKTDYRISVILNEKGIKPSNSDEWSQKSVSTILKNLTYTGKIKFQGRKTVRSVNAEGDIIKKVIPNEPTIFEGLHPAIIDEETFNAVQRLRGLHSRKPNKKRFRSAFASLVKCGVCGRSYTLCSYGGNKQSRMTCRRKQCPSRSVSYNYLMSEVVKGLKMKLEDIEYNLGGENEAPDLSEKIKKELSVLDRQQSRIYELLEKGIYSEAVFVERNDELAENRRKLEKALAEAERNRPADPEKVKVTLHQLIDMLPDPDVPPEDKNILLKSILKQITVTRLGEDEPIVRLYF